MSAGKCPIMYGGATESGMSNTDWWPKSLCHYINNERLEMVLFVRVIVVRYGSTLF